MKNYFIKTKAYFAKSNLRVALLLFVLSFSYILFFTQCVPFFFDDHEFHRDYLYDGYQPKFLELISLNKGASIATGPRPVYGLYFITLFQSFRYDYCPYRIAKAFVFSALILVFYWLAYFLFKRKSISLATTLVMMSYYPTYLQTFGYNGPHIFAETFKILAVLFFLKDITSEQTSIIKQIFVFLFTLLAIRTYAPAYSIAGILLLFTLIYKPKKILRYVPLFFLIIMIQFPITLNFTTFSTHSGSTYTPKFVNIKHAFFNGIAEYITSPVPTYSYLYYKPVMAVISFFGFWLLIFALGGLLLKKLKIPITKKYFSDDNINNNQPPKEAFDSKLIIVLSLVWMLSELPTYIFLPEHAIRYIFTFLVPFTLLSSFFVVTFLTSLRCDYKKYATAFALLFIAGIIVTNISYTYAFRAGWGSSFIVFEEVMDYMAQQHTEKAGTIGILYNAGSVAEEYKYVNKSSPNYSFGEGIRYIKAASSDDFTEEKIQGYAARYDTFYVLKRTTSLSKISYPEIDFDTYTSLQQAAVVEGTDQGIIFDRVNSFLMQLLGIDYEPNKVVIYRVVGTSEIIPSTIE